MSMHKIPLTDLERRGLEAHGLDIGTPSQLSDVFRQGMAWVMLAQAPQPPALGGAVETLLDQIDDYIARINGDDRGSDSTVNALRAHIAPLLADNAALRDRISQRLIDLTNMRDERDTLKARCDRITLPVPPVVDRLNTPERLVEDGLIGPGVLYRTAKDGAQ